MSFISPRRALAAVVLTIGVATTSVGLVYAKGDASSSQSTSTPAAEAPATIRSYDPAAPGAALTGIKGADAAVPTSVQVAYKHLIWSVDPASARSTVAGEGMIAVVATDKENNVVLSAVRSGGQEVGSTSAPAAAIADGNLTLTMSTPETDGQVTVGVVPDGVDTVTVRDRDGTERSIPVTRNVYAVRAPAGASLTFQFEGRDVQQVLNALR